MGFLSWLGGVGSSLISGAAGTIANKSMQEDAQRWQENMYDKQKEFWYEQQEYNSPVNQVKRLNEAGVNEQLALGNIQSGQMGSSPSVGSPSALPAGQFGDITGNYLNILRGKNEQKQTDALIRKTNADAFVTEIDGMSRAADNVAKIAERMANVDKAASERLLNEVNAWSQGIMTFADFRKTMIEGDELQTKIELNVTNNLLAREELKSLPEKNRLAIANLAQDLALKVAQKELTLAQAEKEWATSKVLWQTESGQLLDNQLKEALFKATVEKAIQETVPMIGRYGENTGDWSSSRAYGEYPKKY